MARGTTARRAKSALNEMPGPASCALPRFAPLAPTHLRRASNSIQGERTFCTGRISQGGIFAALGNPKAPTPNAHACPCSVQRRKELQIKWPLKAA